MPGLSARTEPDWPRSPRESRHDSSWLDWLQHDRQPRPVAGFAAFVRPPLGIGRARRKTARTAAGKGCRTHNKSRRDPWPAHVGRVDDWKLYSNSGTFPHIFTRHLVEARASTRGGEPVASRPISPVIGRDAR